MGRPRKRDKDLPPGLYCYPGRSCFIQLGTMRPVPLGTPDRKKALALYWEFRRVWDAQQADAQANELAERLEVAAKGGDRLTVAAYATHWREQRLPTLLKKNGRPLADKTRDDYGRMLENQVEAHGPFQCLAIGALTTKRARTFLARWIASPNFYNYMKSLLSRVLDQAVDEGHIEANPIAAVKRRAVSKREVVCPMADYLAITARLADFEARACDLIYLVSHRPSDVLRLRDEEPFVRYERRADPKTGKEFDAVVVAFTATKNEQAIEVYDDVHAPGGIEETLQWFRDWKAAQEIVTPRLVVFPRTARRRDIGRPIGRDYLYRRFVEAAIAAGFPVGTYTLRDLRKTGLTDEARIAGKATDKGGHKTEQMRQYYVVGGVPARARNNLVVMRGMG